MTSGSTFPQRLTKIDPLTIRDHHYLGPTDECYFLGEYTARRGYSHSTTNQLIFNFKKSPLKRGMAQWRYKETAIAQAGAAFAAALNVDWLKVATLVPLPPSKARTDPLYDDRVTQMLRSIRSHSPLDIREMILQNQSTRPPTT